MSTMPGNYLVVVVTPEAGFLADQPIRYRAAIARGSEPQMRQALISAVREVQLLLARTQMLYSGAEVFGHGVNSNSVWRTEIAFVSQKIGQAIDPDACDSGFRTPGSRVDLRTEPSNNPDVGQPEMLRDHNSNVRRY